MSATANAADITILVGTKKSEAYQFAKSKANKKTVFSAKSLSKAFSLAGKELIDCKTCTVNIKIASGDFLGKGKTGHWMFPDVIVPDARLRILGGYDDSFTTRSPFENQTRLITVDPRGRSVLKFEGKKHALKELYLSGLTFDVAPGNNYDAKNNSLHKGSSSSFSVIAFGYLTTDRLVVADNTFLNAANSVAGPLVRAMSANAEVIIRNNMLLNNIHAWTVGSASFRNQLKRYALINNSFILNWPYNPSPTTSNPGTLEIGNKYSASEVEISKNLFAYNAGGAIHAQWDDVKGPPMMVTENLFWGNGALFDTSDPEDAAVLGKFNGSPKYVLLTADDAEEFEWDVADNVSFDPGLKVQVKPFQAAGSSKAVIAAGASAPVVDASSKPAAVSAEAVDPVMAEFAALLGDDAIADVASTSEQPSELADAEFIPVDPLIDDLGNEDFAELGFGDDGDVQIQGFATRLYVDGKLPFPSNPDAVAYGANASHVEQF